MSAEEIEQHMRLELYKQGVHPDELLSEVLSTLITSLAEIMAAGDIKY